MRYKKRIIIPVLFLISISVLPLSAQQNPFLSSPAADNAAAETQEPQSFGTTAAPSFFSGLCYNSAFMTAVRGIQKSIHSRISEILAVYAGKGESGRFPLFLLFSYLYGLLHVIGPGHRKVFLFSYFIARPSRWKTGTAAGIMTAVLHAFSAVVIVGGLYVIASKALMLRFNNIVPLIERLSYALIAAIGVFLLAHSIRDLRSGVPGKDKAQSHDPDTILFILVSGLVPCPGAAAIMIFALASGVPAAGVWSVAAMSAGMATVLAFVPPLAVLIRSRLSPAGWSQRTNAPSRAGFILSAAGAVFLILLGILFVI